MSEGRRLQDKIQPLAAAHRLITSWQKEGKSVVFTNGCFDILHPGHVLYLEQARSLGDHLVVGLNSDDSVRRLKGPSRPIQDHNSRAVVLSGLSSVDMVIVFEEDTPLDLIKALRPQVLIKGGDWGVKDIVGGREVLSWGGQVRSIHFEKGHSTTRIVEKIQRDEGS